MNSRNDSFNIRRLSDDMLFMLLKRSHETILEIERELKFRGTSEVKRQIK